MFYPTEEFPYPGEHNVIAYRSRALRDWERRYPVYNFELLALVFGLQEFEQYLLGRKFSILTDHRAQTFLQGSSKLA